MRQNDGIQHAGVADAREFTPLADARRWMLAYGARHPRLVIAGSAAAVVAMGLLIAWFVFLSNCSTSPGLVYAGF